MPQSLRYPFCGKCPQAPPLWQRGNNPQQCGCTLGACTMLSCHSRDCLLSNVSYLSIIQLLLLLLYVSTRYWILQQQWHSKQTTTAVSTYSLPVLWILLLCCCMYMIATCNTRQIRTYVRIKIKILSRIFYLNAPDVPLFPRCSTSCCLL